MNYFYDCKTEDEAKKKYRTLSKELHPDAGGSNEKMAELTKQFEDFKKEKSNSQSHFTDSKKYYNPFANESWTQDFFNGEDEFRRYKQKFGGFGFTSNYESSHVDEHEVCKKEIKELTNQNSKLKLNLKTQQEKIESLERNIDYLRKCMDGMRKEYHDLKKEKDEHIILLREQVKNKENSGFLNKFNNWLKKDEE